MPDEEFSHNREIIKAVEVNSADRKENTSVINSFQRSTHITLLLAGFIILLLLAMYVIFLLPRAVEENIKDSNVNQIPPLASVTKQTQSSEFEKAEIAETTNKLASDTPMDNTSQLADKNAAEALLTRLIELESLLNKHSVKKWAAEEFAQATEQGRIGDEYYRRQQYSQAITSFQDSIDQLQILQERIQPTLEQALARGEQALIQGDQPSALQQFELAKSIDSTNLRASNGLQRATTISQLFALLQRASSFESHDQLQQARSTYQEAVQLDPLSNEASSALARVNRKLANKEFKQLIATGYQALQEGQYADARAAFDAAKTLQPKAKESAIGLSKVAAAIREEKIANLLFEAEHFVQLQQWQQAASSYEKILAIRSTHSIAQQGLIDSKNKAKILEDLKRALDSSDQLHQAKVLKRAQQVLATVTNLDTPGTLIEQSSEKLQQLVRVATTPIPIILESDNNTEVTVYKVARLGVFERHKLQLRPGSYTIVGTRIGFRDVRKTIQVTPDSKNSVLSISCEEPI